ncbi:MAG: archaeal proteasome endopeptidase complex subunit beta [Promethearchaeota archaeon]
MDIFVANKNAQKLNKVTDYMWMTIAGGVADAQYLVDLVRAQCRLFKLKRGYDMPVKSAARLLSNVLFQNKFTPYEVGLLLGGVTPGGGPGLYDLGAYGSILPEKYASTGSGSVFALGVLETEWEEGMSLQACKEVCVRAVTSAVVRDMASGNGIDVVVITAEGSEFEAVAVPR